MNYSALSSFISHFGHKHISMVLESPLCSVNVISVSFSLLLLGTETPRRKIGYIHSIFLHARIKKKYEAPSIHYWPFQNTPCCLRVLLGIFFLWPFQLTAVNILNILATLSSLNPQTYFMFWHSSFQSSSFCYTLGQLGPLELRIITLISSGTLFHVYIWNSGKLSQ